MSKVYESIMRGLSEAIEDAQSKDKKLKRHVVEVVPVKSYSAGEIKAIRNKMGLSQRLFAGYMGISVKTVEAWEAGLNHPSGAASRILNMMEMDANLMVNFPFVKMEPSER
ncbi:MAG: helix-turn-helix domain-containing protein [Lachnospiraceae bacterium]|nr:helix-turn-helix domain-containing protein [Lachnospiraceae bacterium]